MALTFDEIWPQLPYAEHPYVQTHRERYRQSLAHIPGDGGHILEIGASWPYTMVNLLRAQHPDWTFSLAENRAESLHPPFAPPRHEFIALPALGADCPETPADAHYFNAELEPWPYADASFDGLICLELLEHLLVDPLFLLEEAARVLRPNGWLILTTPNLASREALARQLVGQSPYLYSVYSPYGPYGRHNREYVPEEVRRLAAAADFAETCLTTLDTYPLQAIPADLAALLNAREGASELRGQTIFYVGRRRPGERDQRPALAMLYDGHDPADHVATVELCDATADTVRLRVHNRGHLPWPEDTRVGVSRYDHLGQLTDIRLAEIPLAHRPNPGETIEITWSRPAHLRKPTDRLRYALWWPDTWPGHSFAPRNQNAWEGPDPTA